MDRLARDIWSATKVSVAVVSAYIVVRLGGELLVIYLKRWLP